jgi:hypothetical protein
MIPAAEQVVQIAIDPLLDGRPVTTLSGGKLVPWTVGIDKDDGYITTAAAQFLKQTGTALPDDATFNGDATHPLMVLHFSNAASPESPQARGVSGVAQFEFDVPHASYSQLFLAVTSSYGDSPIKVTFGYADASSSGAQFTLPDWGTGSALPTNPPIFFNLISGLHKWNHDNASVDTPTHTITGVSLSPDPNKELNHVQIAKSGASSYLVFWGATGIATSPLGNSNGGAGGSGGGAGASGAGAANGGAGGSSAGAPASAGSAGSPLPSAGGAGGSVPASTAGGAATSSAGGSASAGLAERPSDASADSGGCSMNGGRRSGSPSSLWPFALCALLYLRRASSRR